MLSSAHTPMIRRRQNGIVKYVWLLLFAIQPFTGGQNYEGQQRPAADVLTAQKELTYWYIGTKITIMSKTIQRVQTGVRIEKRLLKVLKALAEQLDMSLGDLLEGMALHCFEGKAPFSDATLGKIEKLKDVYELDLTAEDSHKLDERGNDD